MKENKALQTIVGAGVLYLAFTLWRGGWFSAFIDGDAEGFSGPELWASIFAAVLSFVQLVGIFTIGIVSGILPHMEGLFGWVNNAFKSGAEWIKNLAPKVRESGGLIKTEGDGPDWNWKPIALIVFLWWAYNSGLLKRVVDRLSNIINVVDVIPSGEVDAVVFSVTDDIGKEQASVASSVLVARKLQEAGVERRRVDSRQDMSLSEEWLQKAAQDAPDDEPSLVIVADKNKVVDIPSSISEMEQIIASF